MLKRFKNSALLITIFITVMVCFSTLIYGRFTRQYNPEVTGFGVSIATQENMLVSFDGRNGTFTDTLDLEDLDQYEDVVDVTLYPLSATVQPTGDGTYEELAFPPGSEGKYISFPLYFLGSDDMNIYLKGNRGGEVIASAGSTANASFSQEDRTRIMKNIRIGFLTYASTYQTSGENASVMYSELPVDVNVYSQDGIDNTSYETFNSLGYQNSADDVVLATTKSQEITRMDVVIWLEEEGLDASVQALCNLTFYIRFEAVSVNN